MDKAKREPKRPLTLRPLRLDDALKAAMETGPPPELPKKGKKKATAEKEHK